MSERIQSVEQFPALETLTREWQAIRDEVAALDAPVLGIDRVDKSHAEVLAELEARGEGNGWLIGWDVPGGPNPRWLSYGVQVHGQDVLDVRLQLPRTVELVERLQGVRVCALNWMRPGTFLGKHVHPDHRTRGTRTCHLCLTGPAEPSYSYLNVAGEPALQWPGRAYVFEGWREHFALNASDDDRVLLYLEFDPARLRCGVN